MAGRKSPMDGNFFSTLLGKLGLERDEAPEPKKGKRRRKRRPEDGVASPEGTFEADPGSGEASPFADYGASGGLMDSGGNPFAEALSYEAAAAAGFAPSPERPFPVTPPDVGLAAGSPAAATPQPSLPFAPPQPAAAVPAAAPPVVPIATGSLTANIPKPAAPAPLPSQRPSAVSDVNKLFNIDAVGSDLDALFSGLEAGIAPPPIPPVAPAEVPAAPSQPATEQPLFEAFGLTPAVQPATPEAAAAIAAAGTTSPETSSRIHKPIITAPTPQAPAGVPPRLAAVTPPKAPQTPAGSAAALPPPAVLNLADGVNLTALLAAIDRTSGVSGTLLVGFDGLIIATSLPPEIDPDYLGAQACTLFMGNKGQLTKMQRGDLCRIILETGSGAMLVTAADMGILVVVSHEGRAMDIAGVMGAIGGVVGQ